MARERVLITVKTYPTLSRKYGETVCTAGIRPDGSWMRIYPVPFRRLDEDQQYSKYDWIEANFVRGTFDPRPETYHPVDSRELLPVSRMDTADRWRERRKFILGKVAVYDRLTPLLEGAKANALSLALFKPKELIDFLVEDDDPEWPEDKLAEMRTRAQQGELFTEDEEWRKTFQLIPKLPFRFRYRFADAAGITSTLTILDWECGQLYWNCLRRHGNDREIALEKVRQKYFIQLPANDLYFFLGTLQQYHGFSLNPWAIVGLFHPPHENQLEFGII
jgi:hypothetical protein